MKKFTTSALLIVSLFIFSACGEIPFSDNSLSELRSDVFFAENENFSLYAYAELKETPLADDGYAGEKSPFLYFKLCLPVGSPATDRKSLRFIIGEEEYEAFFGYQSVSAFLTCEVPVKSLPEKNFSVTLQSENQTYDFELASLKKINNFDYQDIALVALNSDIKEVNSLLSTAERYEMRIRLLESEGFNYWYVAVISANGGIALLYDAETAELIATKKLE